MHYILPLQDSRIQGTLNSDNMFYYSSKAIKVKYE